MRQRGETVRKVVKAMANKSMYYQLFIRSVSTGRSAGFGKDLAKWMDFDAFKHAVNRIRILAGKSLGLFERVGLDDDETSGLVC